jgi:predicted O-methyltransferase YrrM
LDVLLRHYGLSGGEGALPSVEPAAVFADETLHLARLRGGVSGNVTPVELLTLNSLVRAQAPRRIFEIGTFNGRTTLNLALNAPEAEVFTLDLPAEAADQTALAVDEREKKWVRKASIGDQFRGAPEAARARITQLLGDSATFDYGPYENSVDFVFVDGSHEYRYVLNDTRRAFSLLRDGRGTIVWHDYGVWPGVTRGLDELSRNDPRMAGARRVARTSLVVLTLA